MSVHYIATGPTGEKKTRRSASHNKQVYTHATWVLFENSPWKRREPNGWQCVSFHSHPKLSHTLRRQYENRGCGSVKSTETIEVEATVKTPQPEDCLDYSPLEIVVRGVKFTRSHHDHVHPGDGKKTRRQNRSLKAGDWVGTTYIWEATVSGKRIAISAYRDASREPETCHAEVDGRQIKTRFPGRRTRTFKSIESAAKAALREAGIA